MTLLPDTGSLNVPDGVSSVLLHPELQVNTAHARQGLARGYSMEQWITQQSYLGGFIAACERKGDIELFERCLHDIIIEPQRAVAVPCFEDVQKAAMHNQALGCSLSGSGPSIFALCRDNDAAQHRYGDGAGVSQSRLRLPVVGQQVDRPGARVESTE